MSERRIGTVIWFKTAAPITSNMETFEPYDFQRARSAMYRAWEEGVFIFCAFEHGELDRLKKDFADFKNSDGPDSGSYKCYAHNRDVKSVSISNIIMQPMELNLSFSEVAHIA